MTLSRSGSCSGSHRVESPEPLGGYVTWLERQGTQIHLIHTEGGPVPVLGHAAVVVDDHADTVAAVRGGRYRSKDAQRAVGRAAGICRSGPGATASS